MCQYKDSIEIDIRFHTSIAGNNNLGVYLREAIDVKTPSLQRVTIDPIFLDNNQIGISIEDINYFHLILFHMFRH